MNRFNYFQLIAYFYNGVFDQIKQGSNFEMAVNQSEDDSWLYPESDNRLSNLVVFIHFLNIKYATHKSFTAKQIEVYKTQLELIKDDDLSVWLAPEELEHFNETVFHLNYEIETFLQKQ